MIFIGSVYPTLIKKELIKLGSKIDYPADNFQNALIKGLDSYENKLKIITSPNISSFPQIKKILFSFYYFSHNNRKKKSDIFVKIINIPIIKLISKFFSIRKILNINRSEKTVIIYGVHSPFLWGFKTSKLNATSCLIVPDLPQYMSSNNNIIYKLIKKIDLLLINKSLDKIDCFVLLSPYMKEKLNIINKPCLQIEGIYNPIFENILFTKSKLKTILYVGKLDKRYGIEDLIKSFNLIELNNYRLWIRGDGEYTDYIKKSITKDKRIIYFEKMERNEIIKLEKEATILVNPIHSKEEFTSYFFPSKTLEYMASGTPTLMCNLNCLPSQYKDYLYFFEDESIIGMKNKIIEICNKDQSELNSFGLKASKFINEQKNPQVQAQKILSFIKSIDNKL